MVQIRSLVAALALALGGCATPGLAPGQGGTIAVIASSPAMVVLEYTRWYGGELQAAINMAQSHCTYYGRNAQMGATSPAGPNPVDRVVTTFNCV